MKVYQLIIIVLLLLLVGSFQQIVAYGSENNGINENNDDACTGFQCLYNYVHKRDDTYKYEDTGKRIMAKDYTGYLVNMTSQTWLTSKDSDRPVWWHILVIIVPKKIQHTDFGFLWITGGNNKNSEDINGYNAKNEDIIVGAYQAVHNGIVAGILFQVPNQPVLFATDPIQKQRQEDATIAFTWDHFIKDSSDPTWLLRFPMTKAAVRAFDTMQTFAPTIDKSINLTTYGVAGASKRGWTTWTTAAADNQRVKMMAPVVLDELNMIQNLHHHYRAYNGGWSWALKDYTALNFTKHLDDPNTLKMAKIIDAYWFADRLKGIPKVVINAGMDEFLLPDDTTYWWDNMTEPKHFLITPNSDHSQATGILEILPALSTYMRSVLTDITPPEMTWDIDQTTGEITMKTNVEPIAVDMWYAHSCNNIRRDFRLLNADKPCVCGVVAQGLCLNLKIFWSRIRLTKVAPLTYKASREPLKDGRWTAFFINAQFEGPKPKADVAQFNLEHEMRHRRRLGWPVGVDGWYDFTTAVSIVPRTFPHADCHGDDCMGHLV